MCRGYEFAGAGIITLVSKVSSIYAVSFLLERYLLGVVLSNIVSKAEQP